MLDFLTDPVNANLDSIEQLILRITNMALAIAGTVAIIFILIGVFNYFTAFGDENKAKQGKTIITYAIVGILLILVSRLVIAEVFNFIAASPPTP